MIYKVLKDWGNHKAGETFDSAGGDDSVTAETLVALVAEGTLVEAETPVDEVAANLEKAVDEAIAEAPAKPAWSIVVQWAEGTTEEEKAKVEQEHIVAFAKEIGSSPADHLPFAIESVLIKRIHDGE